MYYGIGETSLVISLLLYILIEGPWIKHNQRKLSSSHLSTLCKLEVSRQFVRLSGSFNQPVKVL